MCKIFCCLGRDVEDPGTRTQTCRGRCISTMSSAEPSHHHSSIQAVLTVFHVHSWAAAVGLLAAAQTKVIPLCFSPCHEVSCSRSNSVAAPTMVETIRVHGDAGSLLLSAEFRDNVENVEKSNNIPPFFKARVNIGCGQRGNVTRKHL